MGSLQGAEKGTQKCKNSMSRELGEKSEVSNLRLHSKEEP